MDAAGREMLAGVRVLDLTRLLPGAYATLLLADLGADVVKVEDPRGGDPMRHMPPLSGGTSAYFALLNRNKRSVTIDLRHDAAADVLGRLVDSSDVVLESFRPEAAKRLGVDALSIRARNPRAVCASITGFGQSGPYRDRAAHDINYQALAGLLSATASGDGPQVPGLLVADIAAAFQATVQVLAGLVARERGAAVPATLDISIHEAALQWLTFPAARRLVDGAGADPRQLPLRGQSPRYNVYRTADDSWVAVGALEPKFWTRFCERIGRPELAGIDEYPESDREAALSEVRALMRTRTRDEWVAHFADLDVCLTPVHSIDEVLCDPQLSERGAVRRDAGVAHLAAAATIRPAPALGEHTDELLGSVGIDAEQRAALRRAAVI